MFKNDPDIVPDAQPGGGAVVAVRTEHNDAPGTEEVRAKSHDNGGYVKATESISDGLCGGTSEAGFLALNTNLFASFA